MTGRDCSSEPAAHETRSTSSESSQAGVAAQPDPPRRGRPRITTATGPDPDTPAPGGRRTPGGILSGMPAPPSPGRDRGSRVATRVHRLSRSGRSDVQAPAARTSLRYPATATGPSTPPVTAARVAPTARTPRSPATVGNGSDAVRSGGTVAGSAVTPVSPVASTPSLRSSSRIQCTAGLPPCDEGPLPSLSMTRRYHTGSEASRRPAASAVAGSRRAMVSGHARIARSGVCRGVTACSKGFARR